MVFYRKYRPQKIDDLDNEKVRETLLSILSRETPHAFLFTGPKGLGKTSTARIVAKVINCTDKKKKIIEPCDTCEQCLSITNNTNMDVLEIDAASNRGIDEIRDLKEKIRLSPLAAKKKVYIIDEVHMLTTEAFNALLKTLEEPPAHAVFILCTTELQKVPATILSRCFQIVFTLATEKELIRSFSRVAKGEGLTIDSEALSGIAKLSSGGFRDGTKILEELASVSENKHITATLLEQKYQTASINYYIDTLLTLIIKGETKSALHLVPKLLEIGIDMKYFLYQTIEKLHDELLVQAGVKEIADSKWQLGKGSMKEINIFLTVFLKAYNDMKSTVIPQLPLELAIIELVKPDDTKDEEIVEHVTVTETVTSEVSVGSLRKKVGDIQRVKALYGEEKEEKKEPKQEAKSNVEIIHFSADGEITKEWLANFWSTFIAEIKSHNHTLAGVLRGCMIKSYDRKSLIIETAYKFHKEKLESGTTMSILENVCKTLVGKPTHVTVVLKNN